MQIDHETKDAATVLIRPGYEWEGHDPGQFLRIGVDIEGVRHWRAYSLTSDPERPDGFISITVKNVDEGKVSPYLVHRGRPGCIVGLGGVEGDFVLPEELPDKLLFISAGSGITPIMSMLRNLSARDALEDVVHLHSDRTAAVVIFAAELHALARRHGGYRLHEQITSREGRITPADLARLCPDWRGREAFLCGPAGLLRDMRTRWQSDGDPARLHSEHFQPDAELGSGEHGAGGPIRFCTSDIDGFSDGTQPILLAGERAGAQLAHGCRMGICRSCVGRLRSGRVRDLRTGRVHGQPGEVVRICINAPEGPVEIDL